MRAARVLRSAVGVALLAAMLAGCESAPDLQQKRIDNPVRADSVNATAGPVRLLATRIETPEDAVHVQGGNVGLYVTLVNSGTAADALVAVSTVDARAVVLRDGAAEPAPAIRVDLPPGGVASLQHPGGEHLELVELKRDVLGGRFLPVTFRFEKAGVTTVDVFVPASPSASPSVSPSPSATS